MVENRKRRRRRRREREMRRLTPIGKCAGCLMERSNNICFFIKDSTVLATVRPVLRLMIPDYCTNTETVLLASG